ncbi:General control protein [Friedmanniomyces endolithicus]|nr:General control protein [Friedmanniomyces endolithicus]KAK0288569.1 General control protein [Friedmanniomyces endolithicus]
MHPAAALGETIGGRRMICLATLVGGDLAWAVSQCSDAGHANRLVACAELDKVWLARLRGVILAAARQPEAFADKISAAPLVFHFLLLLTTTTLSKLHHTPNTKSDAATRCLHLIRPSSPTISTHLLTGFTTPFKFPLADPYAPRLSDTALAINSPPFTTASQQQTWPPSPASARHPPQPTFSDFDLFQTAPTTTPALQATPRRAPSLGSTLQPSFSESDVAAYYAHGHPISNQANYTTQRTTDRSTRPPVPLFHSNSTGSLANQVHGQQFQHDINMGGGVNVAYDGTFGDLGAEDAMFGLDGGFAFDALLDSHAVNNFTAANSGGANGVTVSPRDVFNNNDSIPPSTSFTNLTTPGSTYLETPDDDYQTSPLFTDSFEADHGAQWSSLFPEYETTAATGAPMMVRNASSSSANQIVVHPGGESANRKRSSTNASPAMFSPVVKHSDVAGVGARKRDKPLPPIVVDESDTVALKRARNTAAARKSRAKRVLERDDLEAEITDLKAQVEYWKGQAQASGGGIADSKEG